jgi:hypothetical protein
MNCDTSVKKWRYMLGRTIRRKKVEMEIENKQVRTPLPYLRALHDTYGEKDHSMPSDLETSSASI